MEGFAEKLASKLHHYSVLPFDDDHGTVAALDPFVLTSYTFFLVIAFVVTLVFFLVAAKKGRIQEG